MAPQLSSRGGARDESPPRTPRQRRKPSMRALNTDVDDLDNTSFYEDSTPKEERDIDRDSHDLSLSDNARASVVDNMLLSLDSLQFGGSMFDSSNDFLSSFDNRDYFSTQYDSSQTSRQRGHTYTSSFSAENDLPEDIGHRYPSQRGRRSNSGSNYPSVRGVWGGGRGSNDTQVRVDGTRAGHARGGPTRKGSRGSGSSSVDIGYNQALGSRRLGKRSASFDHSYNERSGSPSCIVDRGAAAYVGYDSYDAAPTPTVPVGPRRFPEAPAAVSPTYSGHTYAPAAAIPGQRHNSLKSGAGKNTRKAKAHPQDAASMRAQATDFFNATIQREPLPYPAYADSSAPSPTVAIRKTSAAGAAPAASGAAGPREKQPGFFRRVFGGGGNSSSSPRLHGYLDHPDLPRSAAQPQAGSHSAAGGAHRPRTTQANVNHSASSLQQKALPKPPSRDSKAFSKEPRREQSTPPPTLMKKPSSFFRRRKKSITEPPRPPLAPFIPQPKVDLLPQQPNPRDSFGNVMHQYLNDTVHLDSYFDSRETQDDDSDSDDEHIRGFSPGYTPHKDATVRAVDSGSYGTVPGNGPDSAGPTPQPSSHHHTDNPKLKLKVKRGAKATLGKPNDETFFADSSGNEDKSAGGRSPSNSFGLADESRRPQTCPTSTSADQGRHGLAIRAAGIGKIPEFPHLSSTEPGRSSAYLSDTEDETLVVTTPGKADDELLKHSSANGRVWLEPRASEEMEDSVRLSLPIEGARTSPALSPESHNDVFHSATSLPILQVDGDHLESPAKAETKPPPEDEEPTQEDREIAEKIFNGEEEIVARSRAAAWLGEPTPRSIRVRKAYMELYDWSGMNILAALRDLCGRLVLKAESQQLDRIMQAFAQRWVESNPNHGFKSTDVVYSICFAVLLLNTDLHLADIESKMSRHDFVKNTLPSLRRIADDSMQENEDTIRAQGNRTRGAIPWNESGTSIPASPTFAPENSEQRRSLESKPSRSRLSLRPPGRSDSEGAVSTSDTPGDNCNVLVRSPYEGSMKGWEFQIEIVLKEFYNSIRQQRLPLHGARELTIQEQPSTNSLSVGGLLRRTPSVLSKAPSDTTSYRGRTRDFRSVGWNSKNKSRPRMYPASTVGSSRTSLDDNSVWSPNGSSTWSKASFGKTQTSMSMESLGSHFAQDYQQSIGFANALSQAIIREEGVSDNASEDFTRVAPLLEDESLELAGAPWAKEGILKHKHHLEALDKRAKDRNWVECFAVIEKGWMRLFSFNANSKSMRHKKHSRPSTGGVVGGGNWMDNAEALGSFLLRQTIASALPPPGYSKSRPHVWALSLPSGAVHLFQAGTPDIVKEFVSTANYWSARLSKEPLVGGVSNMEYGWSEAIINPALIRQDSNATANHAPGSTPSRTGHHSRPSLTSIRSSIDHSTGQVKARLPGDKVVLHDWAPPTQSMMASNLMEVDQLRALTAYIQSIEEELQKHNDLRTPMTMAYSPRHPNAAKAMANWERKSAYLLREIVKFQTYIDSLTAAQALKERIYRDRAAEKKADSLRQPRPGTGGRQSVYSQTAESVATAGARSVDVDVEGRAREEAEEMAKPPLTSGTA